MTVLQEVVEVRADLAGRAPAAQLPQGRDHLVHPCSLEQPPRAVEPAGALRRAPAAQLDRVRELLRGMIEVDQPQHLCRREPERGDEALDALPDPGRAVGDEEHLVSGVEADLPRVRRALLAYVGELICARDYARALGLVAARSRSFWVDRDVGRQAQWEACRLMAELGREIEKVRPALRNANGNPAKWVHAYAGEDGWFRVDSLQRRLETWVAKMDEEPETEKGLTVVRREHEELLKKMANGFAKLLGEAARTIPGALHQTRIHPEVVHAMGGRVAYFFVDAMRFEMGVELARQLEGTKDLTIRPAIAALPTITAVGMAALLPGASASFSVAEQKGKLAASIEGTTMSGLAERRTFLKAKVPDAIDIPLGKLLGTSASQLSKSIGDASLVVVRSQEIDALGESVDELTARAAMEGVIGNVARAIRKLASAGIEHFVVTADHGHQFSIRKHDDMKTDNPGGNTVDIHRRCWIGHGGTTPPGTVRVSGAELGYDTNLDFVFPTGLGVFKAGGGLSFHLRWSRFFGQPAKVYSRALGRHWDDAETAPPVHGGLQETGGARGVAGGPNGVGDRGQARGPSEPGGHLEAAGGRGVGRGVRPRRIARPIGARGDDPRPAREDRRVDDGTGFFSAGVAALSRPVRRNLVDRAAR